MVEDAADLRSELVDYLRFYGMEADGVENIGEMVRQLENGAWDVLVLDLGLPDGDGLAAAQRVRERFRLKPGIVIVTARGHVEDRITGICAGADAYLVKPVNLRELKAVIDHLMVRLKNGENPVQADAWKLDAATFRLHTPGGGAISLTGAEARLLARLFEKPGQVASREILCQHLPPGGLPDETRRLDTLLSRLRAKIEQETGAELPIKTFRNLGYSFTGQVVRGG